jgi:hypothetical protein
MDTLEFFSFLLKMAERWMEPVLDDEPAISSKPINGTLFDISAAAKKSGNQLRHDLNPKYSKHNINSPGNSWSCSCGFRTNFPNRIVCYKCNEPKKGGTSRSQNIPPNAVALLYPKGSPDPDGNFANRTVILSKEGGFHVAEKSKKSRREALIQEAVKRETTRLGSLKIQPINAVEEGRSTLDDDQFHENFRENDFTKKYI